MTPTESLLHTYGLLPPPSKPEFMQEYLNCKTVEDYLLLREQLKQFLSQNREQFQNDYLLAPRLGNASFYLEIVENRIKALSHKLPSEQQQQSAIKKAVNDPIAKALVWFFVGWAVVETIVRIVDWIKKSL